MAAVLNSWKEIATFLDRGVRTVQRWERDQHLPVHRVGSGPEAPVFAFEGELRTWQRGFAAANGLPLTTPKSPIATLSASQTRSRDLQHHRELLGRTRRLLEVQRVKLAALLDTVSTTEKRLRTSYHPGADPNLPSGKDAGQVPVRLLDRSAVVAA